MKSSPWWLGAGVSAAACVGVWIYIAKRQKPNHPKLQGGVSVTSDLSAAEISCSSATKELSRSAGPDSADFPVARDASSSSQDHTSESDLAIKRSVRVHDQIVLKNLPPARSIEIENDGHSNVGEKVAGRPVSTSSAPPSEQDQILPTTDGDTVWTLENEDLYSGAGGREVCEYEIQKILERDDKPIPEFWQKKYEKEARRMWDVFYKINKTNFFKDRHYLAREWSELRDGALNVLEVGCGVGNTALPLLATNPNLKVWCCDFSANAIEYLKEMETFEPARCEAFVSDLTKDSLSAVTGLGRMDVCLMIFVLSAVSPEWFLHVIQNVAAALKPGGRVMFRDYGLYDMAQLKMAEPKGHKIAENFYVRKDGTRAYYFTEAEVQELFEQAGFQIQQLETHRRLVRNRKEGTNMHRRWVQGTFVKTSDVVSL